MAGRVRKEMGGRREEERRGEERRRVGKERGEIKGRDRGERRRGETEGRVRRGMRRMRGEYQLLATLSRYGVAETKMLVRLREPSKRLTPNFCAASSGHL